MTRATVAITTFSQRVTCDRCGLALYVRRADVDRWLRGLGWKVGERDVCPGCVVRNGKESVDYDGDM